MYLKYSHHIKRMLLICVFYYYLDVIYLCFFHTCASVSLRLFSAKFSVYLFLVHILRTCTSISLIFLTAKFSVNLCFVYTCTSVSPRHFSAKLSILHVPRTCTSVSLRHFSAELSLISWTSSLYCRVRADMAVL